MFVFASKGVRIHHLRKGRLMKNDRTGPFQVQVPAAVLSDLQQRLAHTRWSHALEGTGWLSTFSRNPTTRPSPPNDFALFVAAR